MLSDEVKLSKGNCYLAGAGVIILNFSFLFVAVLWIGKDDQPARNAVQIQESREDMRLIVVQLDELKKMLNNQAIKDAEIKGRDFGYSVGRTDKKEGH